MALSACVESVHAGADERIGAMPHLTPVVNAVESSGQAAADSLSRQLAVSKSSSQQHAVPQHAPSHQSLRSMTDGGSLPPGAPSQPPSHQLQNGAATATLKSLDRLPISDQDMAHAAVVANGVQEHSRHSSLSAQPVIDLSHSQPASSNQFIQVAAPAEQLRSGAAGLRHPSNHLHMQSGDQQLAEPAGDVDSLASSSLQPVQDHQTAHPLPSHAEHATVKAMQTSQQSQAAESARLTQQIKQMKAKMIQYASYLDNPEWKQQQPDRGKAVSLPEAVVDTMHDIVLRQLWNMLCVRSLLHPRGP